MGVGEGVLLPSGRGCLVAVAKLRFRFFGRCSPSVSHFFFDGKKKSPPCAHTHCLEAQKNCARFPAPHAQQFKTPTKQARRDKKKAALPGAFCTGVSPLHSFLKLQPFTGAPILPCHPVTQLGALNP